VARLPPKVEANTKTTETRPSSSIVPITIVPAPTVAPKPVDKPFLGLTDQDLEDLTLEELLQDF
jgi:hypothetical protein